MELDLNAFKRNRNIYVTNLLSDLIFTIELPE